MSIIRTERAEVLWAPETTFGVPSGGPWARFDIHDTFVAPDPEFGYEPFFGVFSGRDRATILRGRATLRGSIPDIRLQGTLGSRPTGIDFVRDHVIGPTPGYDELVKPFSVYTRYRDTSGASALERTWAGGKINRASLRAAEGQELRLNIDEMMFLQAYNNRGSNDGNTGFVAGSDPGPSPVGRLMFAQGKVTIHGVEFKRIRSFNLTVDNMVEPRYYIARAANVQGMLHPRDLIEGRRAWKLEISMDVVDLDPDDLALWDFFINQGSAGAGNQTPTLGTKVVLEFNQMGSGEGTGLYTFTLGGDPSTIQPAGVITSAMHGIPAPPTGVVPVTAMFDIDRVLPTGF